MSSHHKLGSIGFSAEFAKKDRSAKEQAVEGLLLCLTRARLITPSHTYADAIHDFDEEAEGFDSCTTEEIIQAPVTPDVERIISQLGFHVYPVRGSHV